MSSYSDGEAERELVEAATARCDADDSWEHHDQTDDHPCSRCIREAATGHTLTICAPGGGSWHYVVTVEQATRVWRYLRTVGAPLVTNGIGAEAATPRRHGDT